MNYRCYQIILAVKHFYTNREQREVLTGYLSNLMDIYRWGAGLAVIGRIRYVGQTVL
jgi:hypothetical protein